MLGVVILEIGFWVLKIFLVFWEGGVVLVIRVLVVLVGVCIDVIVGIDLEGKMLRNEVIMCGGKVC